MTRSIRRRPMTVALAVAAAATITGLVAGCGSGQIAQTSQMVASVPGGSASVTVPGPDGGQLGVRNVTVDYPGPQGYPAGADVPLTVRIFNDLAQNATLIGVQAGIVPANTPGQPVPAGTVTLVTPSASASAPAAASGAPSASGGSASASTSRSTSASASASRSASPSASPSASTPAAIALTIRASTPEVVLDNSAGGQYLRINQISRPLGTADRVRLVLTFRLADGSTVAIGADQPFDVPVAPPASPAPRSPMDLTPGA